MSPFSGQNDLFNTMLALNLNKNNTQHSALQQPGSPQLSILPFENQAHENMEELKREPQFSMNGFKKLY